jgi:hypothetical protein
MKRTCIVFALSCAAFAFGQTDATHKSATKKKTTVKAAATAPQSGQIIIPKAAVLDPKDGNYHFTDKDGRKWVYFQGPMGVSRWEDKTAAAAPQEKVTNFSQDPDLKVTDQGETVKFVRNTPFGAQTWTKKKSDLTADERAMLPAAPASPAAGNDH